MSAREQILDAAKTLLWQRGYEAMSPRAVLAESGAGQGSLYHHFRGKADLAATAITEVSADLCTVAGIALSRDLPPLERVVAYLSQPREALRGCRLGRIAAEPVIADGAIREPIAAYFAYIEGELAAALADAQRDGTLRDDLAAGTRDRARRRGAGRVHPFARDGRPGEDGSRDRGGDCPPRRSEATVAERGRMRRIIFGVSQFVARNPVVVGKSLPSLPATTKKKASTAQFLSSTFPIRMEGPIRFSLAWSAVPNSAETFRILSPDTDMRKVEPGECGALRRRGETFWAHRSRSATANSRTVRCQPNGESRAKVFAVKVKCLAI